MDYITMHNEWIGNNRIARRSQGKDTRTFMYVEYGITNTARCSLADGSDICYLDMVI